jgi:hypothetical protein
MSRREIRIRVAGEMRFREQCEAADAVGLIELMPGDLAENVQTEIAYDAFENLTQADRDLQGPSGRSRLRR